jgi:hypothetical protein
MEFCIILPQDKIRDLPASAKYLPFRMIYQVINALKFKRKNNIRLGFHTLLSINSIYPSTIWDKCSARGEFHV